jgi:hypothetical protein
MRRISSNFLMFSLTLAAMMSGAGGCATTVRPVARPIDPVAVFLTDYGLHSSLMLPTPDGRYVEYSFGDYGYAALNRGGPHNALGALFVSGQSGIGRRFLSVRPGEESPRPAYAPKSFQKLFAERFQVYALVKQLDQRYRRGKDEPVHNAITDSVFVKDTEHYSIANNCNHMTARMLRQLGCEVRGNTGASAFKVVGAQQLPPRIDTGTYVQTTTPQPEFKPSAQAARARETRRQSAPPAARPASFTKLDLD